MLTPQKVMVQFLLRNAHLPREQWPVVREEMMSLNEYLELPMATLADTKAKLLGV